MCNHFGAFFLLQPCSIYLRPSATKSATYSSTLCKGTSQKRSIKVPFTCSKRWQIFFRKSVARIDFGHLFCPFFKYGNTFMKKGSRHCIIEN